MASIQLDLSFLLLIQTKQNVKLQGPNKIEVSFSLIFIGPQSDRRDRQWQTS